MVKRALKCDKFKSEVVTNMLNHIFNTPPQLMIYDSTIPMSPLRYWVFTDPKGFVMRSARLS